MQSIVVSDSACSVIGAGGSRDNSRLMGFGELEQCTGFHHDDVIDLSPAIHHHSFKSSSVAVVTNFQFGSLNTNFSSSDIITSGTGVGIAQGAMPMAAASLGSGHFENWGDSAVADTSQQTDTSTDVDTDDRNEQGALVSVDSIDRSQWKTRDQKALRRLAQNREAARKSRLRKKAYVQQLESSRLKLTQLEQELQQARRQGILVGSGYSGDQTHIMSGNGALAFDVEYARWLDEHQRHINELRAAVNSCVGDNELCLLVDSVIAHYDEIFRLKSIGAKSDVFHMLSGMWRTPAERCFMWLGGFRSSEILKILGSHLEPLADQQLMGICNLQQSCQQAEDALSQGMEALQQSLAETLSSDSLGPSCNENVAGYMAQMALAMGKLGTLENFLHQADLLRQQTLQQMHRILTTRQAARALLVINDYFSRLRALSSLWLARPKG